MSTLSDVCIVVHDGMLAAAVGEREIRRFIEPDEAKQIQQQRYLAGGTPYPAWYIFGSAAKNVNGLLQAYGTEYKYVSLCPESMLPDAPGTALFDVQFCTLPDQAYYLLREQGVNVSGYLPEDFSSKSCQAAVMHSGTGRLFLPSQATYSRDSTPVLPDSENECWIVKYPRGSAGNSDRGKPYTVWTREAVASKLPYLLSGLSAGEELIVSEFIHTADPYAGNADHVVHKMHFVCCVGDNGAEVRPYGTFCQKFIFRCDRHRLAAEGTLTLGKYLGTPEISIGCVATVQYFSEFTSALRFWDGRVIFSGDFIIPPDGIPRFLEINKIAATFADVFDASLPPIIDSYPTFPI